MRGLRMRGRGEGRDVFVCALMRALAGTAGLPCTLHLKEVTFLAWRLLSLRKRMCCNATRELFSSLIEGCCCGGLCCGVEFWECFLRREDVRVGAGQGCVWVCTHALACRDGTSPLWAASFGGNLSCVEALILAKADVLQCDK